MRKYLRYQIETRENGLVMLQLPTGYGKTYEITHSMKEQVDSGDTQRKIIYLTTLNKNLPEQELQNLCETNSKQHKRTVLRLKANVDEVKDKLLNMDIPESFQTDNYNALVSTLNIYRNANENSIRDKKYLEELEKRVSDAEKVFRKELTKRLAKDFGTKTERLLAIRTKKEYHWIGELYPAVYTEESPILLLSISKFLKKNSTIIEPSYEFLKADFLKNAIIFIDEFDASKGWIWEEIIKRSLDMKNDYISLFNHISRTLVKGNLSRDLLRSAESVTGHYILQSLLEESEKIINHYYTNLSIKVADTSIDRTQNFLLKDGTFHSILQKGAQYIRTARDEEENRVLIHFENKEEFYLKRKEDDIAIYSMLRDISNYLNHFRVMLFAWGERYAKEVNKRRKDNNSDKMSIENAVASILTRLDLDYKQQLIILGELCGSIVQERTEERLPDNSFYQRGMEIFSFLDNDSHNDFTSLEFVQIFDSPEKILLYLAKRGLVFGVSATAEIPTVVGNYDLSYVQEKLGEDYIPMDRELFMKIKNELNNKWKKYEDGIIQVHAEIVKNLDGGFELDEVCRAIFDNSEYGDVASNLIRQMNVDQYYQKRYCNILKTMSFFAKETELKSMLYLGQALPKNNSQELNEELLHKLEKLVLQDAAIETEDNLLVVLKSENFDNEKEHILKELALGKKKYIMSSYQTIGAGQNLQYEITNLPEEIREQLIELVPYKNNGDKRHFYKDIDAIYLGDVTNKTVNTFSGKEIKENEALEMLVQIEELYYNGELNFAQMESMMKSAFDAKQGKKANNILYKTRSVRMRATQQVLQAVGRMCRTHMKTKNIYLFIDEKLLESLDERELKRRILPPEMKSLLKLKESIGKKYTEKENVTLNIAERISSEGNWLLHQLLARDWTERSIQIWRELRYVVLKYPTASSTIRELETYIRKLYITAGEPINSYIYSQYTDFSDVVIDFSNDVTAFRNSGRAKIKGETNDIIVSKVSSDDAKLEQILKYPGMKEYFIEQGYATSFKAQEYIMSPVLFHNIYKGALGEVAGAFILNAERGIILTEITDATKFEFFDYEISNDVYVDFKNWKFTYAQDREKSLKEISRKLDAIGAKRVYIINVVANENYRPGCTADERIIEIPYLIDENGQIIQGALDMIHKEDYER